MPVFSSLRRVLQTKTSTLSQVRNSGFSVPGRPSRWMYDRFKDDLHFYALLTGIPVGIAITTINLFYSNGQLSAIPDGYTPKEWEYYPNPITRFITRYFKIGYQELYEVHLHNMWECAKVSEMSQLKNEVKRQMAMKGDYKGWYHRSDMAKYARQRRAMNIETTDSRGDHLIDE
eukprot:TRINITY_DN7517_c0_g1_i1.p1 TRINITY_DN7517_c0_g1~~TRINITY_DN7517_c0_g1_i1.p1  ORF type:complete len:174 (-),score=21.94 TRINITY_DN7517_c0_g1_i1:71-592(-)